MQVHLALIKFFVQRPDEVLKTHSLLFHRVVTSHRLQTLCLVIESSLRGRLAAEACTLVHVLRVVVGRHVVVGRWYPAAELVLPLRALALVAVGAVYRKTAGSDDIRGLLRYFAAEFVEKIVSIGLVRLCQVDLLLPRPEKGLGSVHVLLESGLIINGEALLLVVALGKVMVTGVCCLVFGFFRVHGLLVLYSILRVVGEMWLELNLLVSAIDRLFGLRVLGGDSIFAPTQDHESIHALVVAVDGRFKSCVESRCSLDFCLRPLATLCLPHAFPPIVTSSLTRALL